MKRLAIASMIMSFLAAAGCTTSQPAGSGAAAGTQPEIITAQQDGQTVALAKEKTIRIQLAGNITTGFSWQLKSLNGDALEQVGKIEYGPNDAPKPLVGGGGKFTATFKAVKAGSGTIELVYVRSWEKNTPPSKTFTLTVKVE